MNFSFGTPKTTGGPALGTPTTSTSAAFGGGLSAPQFGSGGTGLPFGTPASSAPTTGIQFGGTPAPSSGTFGTPNTNPVSFGALAPAAITTAVANTSALSSFSLGSTLTAQTTAPTALGNVATTSNAPTLPFNAPNTSAPTLNFSLGSTLANTGTTTTAVVPAATGFTLGNISSTGLTLGTPATTSTTFSLGKTIATPANTQIGLSLTSTNTTSTTLTTTTTSTTTAGAFTFTQLEEALNKWTLELEEQGKMFVNQALQLNAWDRLVIANGEKILTLNNGIEKVKQQQIQLDHELDFVLAQQRELEECIAPLEKELKDVPVTDQDRNHTYQIAENMDTQLKQMSEDLKEIIEHLNETNKSEDTNDPVAQIGRILNAHMNSLQWIDRNTALISSNLDQISKLHDMHRQDNQRSFHLTYE